MTLMTHKVVTIAAIIYAIYHPLRGLLLPHLCLALCPRYYQFAVYLTTCDLEKSLTFDNKA